MNELIGIFAVLVLIVILSPRFMAACKIISEERMIEFYKFIGAILKKSRR